VNAAAGSDPGQIIVPILTPTVENNFAGLGLRDQKWEQGDAVPVSTVDSLELRHCRLLSIDVEGMELEVLQGAEATLATCAPIVFVANYRKDRLPALIAHLLDRGYQLYWDIVTLYNPGNFAANDKNVFTDVVNVGMIGMPPGDPSPVEGRKVSGPADSWNGNVPISTFVTGAPDRR
jgi:hypothetical protein